MAGGALPSDCYTGTTVPLQELRSHLSNWIMRSIVLALPFSRDV